MRPEDITELNDNEDNKENEVELTENDNQETSTHSEYKIPEKQKEEYHITFPACIRTGSLIMLRM